MDGARNVVDSHLALQVDKFNTMISDFNSRCGNYRFDNNDMQLVNSYLESYRSMLLDEGRGRFKRYTSNECRIIMRTPWTQTIRHARALTKSSSGVFEKPNQSPAPESTEDEQGR